MGLHGGDQVHDIYAVQEALRGLRVGLVVASGTGGNIDDLGAEDCVGDAGRLTRGLLHVPSSNPDLLLMQPCQYLLERLLRIAHLS